VFVRYKLIFPDAAIAPPSAPASPGLGASRAVARATPRENPRPAGDPIGRPALHGPLSFSICHLLGEPGQVFPRGRGDVDAVQDVLSAEARRRFRAPGEGRPTLWSPDSPWPGDR
jgi:hypothetical protein